MRDGRAALLRTAAALTWLAMSPGFGFVRQRSNFIQGWEAAAPAGGPLASGASGAVGSPEPPALGSWMMLPELSSPTTQTVLPMNDSLYGAAHLELDRQGPVLIGLPADTDGRYYSVSVMDGNFTNVLHLGPRWSGRDAVEVLLVPPGWGGQPPDGTRVVESPTASVCLLNRILVLDVEGDLDRVRAWRAGFTIRPLDGPPVDVEHDDLVHPDAQVLADPWRFLEIGADHLRRNPLPKPAGWATSMVPLTELLAARGEGWSREAVEAGVADAQAMVDATLTDWPRAAGWRLPFPGMGLPTDRVLDTAALELFQVGYNDMAEATYFFCDVDADDAALDATGRAEYELAFAADNLPPVHPDGFWSLTMYGTDNLLVANDLQRYSTRPTRPGFRTGAEGSVTITLSHRAPESGNGPNWLPAPDGRFRLGLRLYYPKSPVLQGTWSPPAPRRTR